MTDDKIFDVIVVGLGLAGSAAAIALAQRGARVLALESGSFPRRKVCGEFLSGESRATLGRLQVLEDAMQAGGREVSRARIFAPHVAGSSRPERALDAPLATPGLALSRWELDRILFERALEAGVCVQTQARTSRLEPIRDGFEEGWRVHVGGKNGARTYRSKYLLATSGRSASWWSDSKSDSEKENPRFVGLKAHFADVDMEVGVSELHAWRGGYCGLMRVEGNAANACLLARYDSLGGLKGRTPAQFWEALLETMPLLRGRMKRAALLFPWMATANVHFSPPTPLRRLALAPSTWSRCEVMCAGDAAGFIHPLTGDGMAMALRGGELAAAAIGAALQNSWDREALHEMWRLSWEREFASRLKWARPLQKALIDPNISRLALPLFRLAPGLVRAVVNRTRGHA